jgi:DNA-binding NtrC family response regulator
VGELLRREGECLDHEGRHEEAHLVLNEALAVCEVVGDRFEIAVTRRCLGVNTANLGRWKAAGELLEIALEDLRDLTARYETMIASHRYAQVLVRQIDSGHFVSGKAGAQSGRLLEEAWNQALIAQQMNQELEIPHLRGETTEMVSGLARRRLLGQERPVRPAAFSARRAPATRIVAVSTAMQQVVRRCDGFARYDSPVLIRGESGTGKRLLARRIHENGPRGAMPFVSVSCASASPDIMARELFGQTTAAGPGIKSLPGLVSQAEGGTLYLRDIEALPRQLQGKLLRLIQENIYRPVGDSRERLAEVRIIVSTTADLAGLVDEGAFQPNLYFRLKIMSVEVAPLRARPQDIMPLLDHFLTRLEDSPLAARAVFDFQGLETLADHRWPGNTAEVEAIAQQTWLARNLGRSVSVRLSGDQFRPSLGNDLDFAELVDRPQRRQQGQGGPQPGHLADHPVPMVEAVGPENGLRLRDGARRGGVPQGLIKICIIFTWRFSTTRSRILPSAPQFLVFSGGSGCSRRSADSRWFSSSLECCFSSVVPRNRTLRRQVPRNPLPSSAKPFPPGTTTR